jgi:hypothetical protein
MGDRPDPASRAEELVIDAGPARLPAVPECWIQVARTVLTTISVAAA